MSPNYGNGHSVDKLPLSFVPKIFAVCELNKIPIRPVICSFPFFLVGKSNKFPICVFQKILILCFVTNGHHMPFTEKSLSFLSFLLAPVKHHKQKKIIYYIERVALKGNIK